MEAETKIAFIFDVLEREPFLEQWLLQIIKRFRIAYYVFFDEENSSIVLNVQGKQREIKEFSDAFSLEFPTSLMMHFQRALVLPDDAIIQSYASTLPSFSSAIQDQRPLPQKVLQMIDEIDDLKGFPYGGELFLEKREILKGQEALHSVVAESFRALAYKLVQGEEVCMQTLYGLKVFTLDASKREWVIPSDLAAVEMTFNVNTAEMEVLNSWERPLVFLSMLETKACEKDHFSLYPSSIITFNDAVVMPYDYSVHLLMHALRQFDVDVCYAYSSPYSTREELISAFRNVFLAEKLISIEPMKIAVARDSKWINVGKDRSVLDCSHYLEAFMKESATRNSNEQDCAISYLCLHASYDLPTMGAVSEDDKLQKALDITISLSLEGYFDKLAGDEVCREFIANTPHVQELLANAKQESEGVHREMVSHNLFDFVGLVYQILYDRHIELNGAKINMLQYAQFCTQPIVPITFDYRIEESEVILEPLGALRSCLKYKLEGVSEEVLALSLVMAMAKFYGEFLQKTHEHFKTHKILLSGSMFSYVPFLNALLEHLPKSIPYALPRILPLDCLKAASKWYNLC